MPDRPCLLLLLLLASPAAAQDDPRLQRALEMPAQERLAATIAAPDAALAPFATDGCSGGLSGSWQVVADVLPGFAAAHQGLPPWEDCCVTHDRAYHAAGGAADAAAGYAARLTADRSLRACVLATGEARVPALAARYSVRPEQVRRAYDAIAEAMFTAVRFGGGPCTGLPWRWGYGWPNCTLFQP